MTDSAGTGNTAPALTTITILIFIWAFVSYLVRLYVKLRRVDTWGNDDVSISIAAFASLAQIITVCYAVHRGYGNPWSSIAADDKVSLQKSLYASQILYVVVIGFTKISTGFFTATVLTRDPREIKIAYASVGLCIIWLIASVFVIALRGNLTQPWETFNGSRPLYDRWLAIEGAGFAIDFLMAGLADHFVFSLQMPISKKLAVSGILSCRLILAIPVAFRLYYLHPAVASGHHMPADIITEVIMGLAIICSSLTCLKPFLRPFDPVAFNTNNASRSGLFRYTTDHNSTRGDRYLELSRPYSAAAKREMEAKSASKSQGGGGTRSEEDEIPLADRLSSPGYADKGAGHVASAWSTSPKNGRSKGNVKSISKTESFTVSVSSV